MCGSDLPFFRSLARESPATFTEHYEFFCLGNQESSRVTLRAVAAARSLSDLEVKTLIHLCFRFVGKNKTTIFSIG
jgi:hypothetical protein